MIRRPPISTRTDTLFPYTTLFRSDDTAHFHAALKAACDAHDADYYPRFKAWADDYFFIPHRGVHRGVGGIFYAHLEGDFDAGFAFTRDVGEAFLRAFPPIVRRTSEAPRVGQGCVLTGRCRWWRY